MLRADSYSLKINWKPEKVTEALVAGARKGLAMAAAEFQENLKTSISIPYPPASAPGEPPHKRTAQLRDSIATEEDNDGDIQRVGTDVDYGRHLEWGMDPENPGLAPRPFFRPMLASMTGRIVELVSQGAKDGLG